MISRVLMVMSLTWPRVYGFVVSYLKNRRRVINSSATCKNPNYQELAPFLSYINIISSPAQKRKKLHVFLETLNNAYFYDSLQPCRSKIKYYLLIKFHVSEIIISTLWLYTTKSIFMRLYPNINRSSHKSNGLKKYTTINEGVRFIYWDKK